MPISLTLYLAARAGFWLCSLFLISSNVCIVIRAQITGVAQHVSGVDGIVDGLAGESKELVVK